MKRLALALLGIYLFIGTTVPVLAAPTHQYQGAVVTPRPNAVLRGQVSVEGTANHPDFWKYEIQVTPGLDQNARDDLWIRILVREQPVVNGQLAVWDTTRLPDGVYTLRLRVVRLDGNWQDFDILPLNIANTAPPTSTPVPPTNTPEPLPTATVTEISVVTSTPAVLPTLVENVVQPTPLALATQPVNLLLTATPIVIDQPTIAVAIGGEDPPDGGDAPAEPTNEDAVSPAPQESAGTESGIVELIGSAFDLGGFATACLYGAAISLGLFLILGVLYLLKLLVRLVQSG